MFWTQLRLISKIAIHLWTWIRDNEVLLCISMEGVDLNGNRVSLLYLSISPPCYFVDFFLHFSVFLFSIAWYHLQLRHYEKNPSLSSIEMLTIFIIMCKNTFTNSLIFDLFFFFLFFPVFSSCLFHFCSSGFAANAGVQRIGSISSRQPFYRHFGLMW